jgi:hypothetical protein
MGLNSYDSDDDDEYGTTATNAAKSNYQADTGDSLRSRICLSDCDMKITGCESSATDCMRQCVFKLCCCGLPHMQPDYLEANNRQHDSTSDKTHDGHHGRKGSHKHHHHEKDKN